MRHNILKQRNDGTNAKTTKCSRKMCQVILTRSKDILDCFEERYKHLEFDFRTAAERFRIIENDTYSIIIPYDKNAEKLINEAKSSESLRSITRKLQPYTISVYENEYTSLLNNNQLKIINEGLIVLDNFAKNYDTHTGLIIPNDTTNEK